jgi:hypothetical protein
VAVNFSAIKSKEIFNILAQIEKYFRKGKLTLMIITSIGGKSEAEQ